MDPIAHTLVGATLAASGLRRRTPLATAGLLLGANAPDIDVVSYAAGPYAAFAFRRGWTHGVLAIAVLPLLVTGLLLLWDRWFRQRAASAQPARAGPLLGVVALAVLTHPALDWLNNYGLRWLMPFDGRWFYGDAVFIIDPWLWLGLGGVATLMYSPSRRTLLAWGVFWLVTSLVVLSTALVPVLARIIWGMGVLIVLAARASGFAAPRREPALERAALIAIAAAGLYVGAAAIADLPERAGVRAALEARGLGPVTSVMVAPVPANPFAGDILAVTPAGYRLGRWHWLDTPHVRLEPGAIPRNLDDPVVTAAAATVDARRFLTWSRFPYAEIEATPPGGHRVRFLDARYAGMGARLAGPVVELDASLAPIDPAVTPPSHGAAMPDPTR
jgi:inner membrane protein